MKRPGDMLCSAQEGLAAAVGLVPRPKQVQVRLAGRGVQVRIPPHGLEEALVARKILDHEALAWESGNAALTEALIVRRLIIPLSSGKCKRHRFGRPLSGARGDRDGRDRRPPP